MGTHKKCHVDEALLVNTQNVFLSRIDKLTNQQYFLIVCVVSGLKTLNEPKHKKSVFEVSDPLQIARVLEI